MADFNIVDTAKFVIDILDRKGGIKFNTNMVNHNHHNIKESMTKSQFKELKRNQIIIIGTKDQPITKRQIRKFLHTLYNYMQQEAFQNGRSYCFGGIDKIKSKQYSIIWGS